MTLPWRLVGLIYYYYSALFEKIRSVTYTIVVTPKTAVGSSRNWCNVKNDALIEIVGH